MGLVLDECSNDATDSPDEYSMIVLSVWYGMLWG